MARMICEQLGQFYASLTGEWNLEGQFTSSTKNGTSRGIISGLAHFTNQPGIGPRIKCDEVLNAQQNTRGVHSAAKEIRLTRVFVLADDRIHVFTPKQGQLGMFHLKPMVSDCLEGMAYDRVNGTNNAIQIITNPADGDHFVVRSFASLKNGAYRETSIDYTRNP